MAKVKTHLINPRERYEIVGEFFEIITNLKTKKDVIDFLLGLITSSELLMIARRIQIAKRLLDEKVYEDIRKEMKVSYQTIAKVYGWLYSGKEKYISEMFKKIEKNKKGATDGRKHYESLLGKYPQHRFFKELFG
jgi:uncharacterized protein YerC